MRIPSLVGFTLLLLLLILPAFGAASKPGDYYVAVDQTEERLGPSPQAKSTNTLFKRQKVTVMELKAGWARVSRYYDGNVEGVKGQVARWIPADVLSSTVPPEEKVSGGTSALGQALKDSDNFGRYHTAFLKGAQSLIDSGRCSCRISRTTAGSRSRRTIRGVSTSCTAAVCGGRTASTWMPPPAEPSSRPRSSRARIWARERLPSFWSPSHLRLRAAMRM